MNRREHALAMLEGRRVSLFPIGIPGTSRPESASAGPFINWRRVMSGLLPMRRFLELVLSNWEH
jgi:hypothetical protein